MKNKFEPLVSIVIPVYKGDPYLKYAIESALNQTYKNIEVIVVNDGSPDEGKTRAIAKSFGKKIRYFEKENGGVATALNYGIKKMKGEYFSWLSHDDLYCENKIEESIKFISSLKDKETVIYNDVMYIDELGDKISFTNYSELYSQKQLSSGIFGVIHGLLNGCAMMIHKSCFQKVGLFDENFPMANDYLMWFNLSKKYKFKHLPKILTKYRFHPNQTTNSNKQYLKDSDNFWNFFVGELSEKEIAQYDGDPHSTFMHLKRMMKEANLIKAEKFAEERKQKYEFKPEVTVIMPCYNSEKYLQEAIDSLLSQSYMNFKLLIVDDSSTDKTNNIAKENAKLDYRIQVVNNKYKKGISGAMNTGLDLTETKYVTRMDSDDISLFHRLYTQVSFLENNKKFGACSVDILGQVGNEITETIRMDSFDCPTEWKFLFINAVANAPMMYKNNIISKNKLRFNELKTAEDYDFITNFLMFSRVKQLETPLYIYRIYKESIFQRNIGSTINRSKIIYNNFIKKLNPKFSISKDFEALTAFYQAENNKPFEVDYLSCINDSNKFLDIFSQKWSFTEEEKIKSKQYINNIIYKHAVWRFQKEVVTHSSNKYYKTRKERLIQSIKKEGIGKTGIKIVKKLKNKILKKVLFFKK